MLINIATAVPPYKTSQANATEALKKRMSDARPAIARMIDAVSNHSGIEFRNFVVPDADDSAEQKFFSKDGDYVKPDTKIRMMEYEKWSRILAVEAVQKLFNKTRINPEEIDRLLTISCTGFFAPGLDYQIIKELKIPLTVKRTNIGFMGCAASIIGFNSVLEAISARSQTGVQNILMVSVELCSLHLQTEPTKDNILANMIFADGAAAVLFSTNKDVQRKGKLEFVGTNSVLFEDSAEFMGWKIGNFGFEMILSSELPKIILEQAVPALIKILLQYGLQKDDIKHWALHPGGRAILDSLQIGLGLNEFQMIPSRKILQTCGNMSSASILFVMEEIIHFDVVKKDELICAVAFGPGLSMEVALMRGI